jgi:hypothetical protein
MTGELPLARTSLEARLYLDLRSCPNCGGYGGEYDASEVTVDGVPATRYTGVCPHCGAERVYEFRLPGETPEPARRRVSPGGGVPVSFGGDEPSQLIDPGVWLRYSDEQAALAPAGPAGLDVAQRIAACDRLDLAIAAVEEVLKFLPAGYAAVQASAFFSPEGRALYERSPVRFSGVQLQSARQGYSGRRWTFSKAAALFASEDEYRVRADFHAELASVLALGPVRENPDFDDRVRASLRAVAQVYPVVSNGLIDEALDAIEGQFDGTNKARAEEAVRRALGIKRLDLSTDKYSWGDDLRLEYQGEPFTGEVVETIGGVTVLSQDFYVDGIPDGPSREWYVDGTLEAEGRMSHGRPTGLFRRWHPNGQLAKEKEFNVRGELVATREWDENGQPIGRLRSNKPGYTYGSPVLDDDGTTVLLPFQGQSSTGTYFHGTIPIKPGDERYQGLLRRARDNRKPGTA